MPPPSRDWVEVCTIGDLLVRAASLWPEKEWLVLAEEQALYPLLAQTGGDVIGLDWRVSLGQTWDALGDVAVQGNLDPYSLLAPRPVLEQRAQAVLDEARGRPGHIFNLGHGIFPSASVDQARALVDYVHEASSKKR